MRRTVSQPCSVANFASSLSDIEDKILSSAGCVMNTSGLMASAAEIFAAKAGKCSRMFDLSFHRFRRFSQICRMHAELSGSHETMKKGLFERSKWIPYPNNPVNPVSKFLASWFPDSFSQLLARSISSAKVCGWFPRRSSYAVT